MIAKVALSAATYAIDKPYSYKIPEGMTLQPGQRVQLPFGRANKRTEGVVLTVETGSEEKLPCDLLLIAAGFLGCQSYVAEAFGVELTPRTVVRTEAGKYATSVPKVFTAGDMHRGQSLVVWAIQEGRSAAREVDEYLMGYTNL